MIVRVEPSGVELDVLPGESLFAAAGRLGFIWPTVCGGLQSCMTCACEVRAGADALNVMSEAERTKLAQAYGSAERDGRALRLACLIEVVGEGAVVHKRAVRPAASG